MQIAVDLRIVAFGGWIQSIHPSPRAYAWANVSRPLRWDCFDYRHSGVYSQRVGRSEMYCATRGRLPRLGELAWGSR